MRISLTWLLIVVSGTALLLAACATSGPTATRTINSEVTFATRPASTPTPTLSPTPVTPVEEPSAVSQDLGAPDPQSLPEASAPGRLGRLTLPGDTDGIVAVFAHLPSQVDGRPRSTRLDQGDPSGYSASYGEAGTEDCSPLRLQARDISDGDFYPVDWTADVFIAWWTLGADWEVDAAGREGDLFWVLWNTTCSTEPSSVVFPVFSLLWGGAGSLWVFSAQADTPEELNALILAFVAGDGGSCSVNLDSIGPFHPHSNSLPSRGERISSFPLDGEGWDGGEVPHQLLS